MFICDRVTDQKMTKYQAVVDDSPRLEALTVKVWEPE